MFSDPKYTFSACQKYFFSVSKKLVFFTEFNLPMHYVKIGNTELD